MKPALSPAWMGKTRPVIRLGDCIEGTSMSGDLPWVDLKKSWDAGENGSSALVVHGDSKSRATLSPTTRSPTRSRASLALERAHASPFGFRGFGDTSVIESAYTTEMEHRLKPLQQGDFMSPLLKLTRARETRNEVDTALALFAQDANSRGGARGTGLKTPSKSSRGQTSSRQTSSRRARSAPARRRDPSLLPSIQEMSPTVRPRLRPGPRKAMTPSAEELRAAYYSRLTSMTPPSGGDEGGRGSPSNSRRSMRGMSPTRSGNLFPPRSPSPPRTPPFADSNAQGALASSSPAQSRRELFRAVPQQSSSPSTPPRASTMQSEATPSPDGVRGGSGGSGSPGTTTAVADTARRSARGFPTGTIKAATPHRRQTTARSSVSPSYAAWQQQQQQQGGAPTSPDGVAIEGAPVAPLSKEERLAQREAARKEAARQRVKAKQAQLAMVVSSKAATAIEAAARRMMTRKKHKFKTAAEWKARKASIKVDRALKDSDAKAKAAAEAAEVAKTAASAATEAEAAMEEAAKAKVRAETARLARAEAAHGSSPMAALSGNGSSHAQANSEAAAALEAAASGGGAALFAGPAAEAAAKAKALAETTAANAAAAKDVADKAAAAYELALSTKAKADEEVATERRAAAEKARRDAEAAANAPGAAPATASVWA